jgi:hypothetical protein
MRGAVSGDLYTFSGRAHTDRFATPYTVFDDMAYTARVLIEALAIGILADLFPSAFGKACAERRHASDRLDLGSWGFNRGYNRL